LTQLEQRFEHLSKEPNPDGLRAFHGELEENLQHFGKYRFLTPDDEMKVRTLKKLKLKVKELLETHRG